MKNPKNPKRKPLDLALFYLSRQARTKKEISDKLALKGFEISEIEPVIAQLAEWRFVDDFQFSRNFIRNSKLGNPKGKRRILFELIRKGVEKSLIEKALEEELADEEPDLARSTLEKYLKKNPNLAREKMFNRSISYLLRRGFSYDMAKKAYNELTKDQF